MNERIKELVIQAEAAADEIFDRKGKIYSEIVMEKFAELIVKETILQMCIQMLEHGDDQSNNPAFYKAIEGTEKYLGIKQ